VSADFITGEFITVDPASGKTGTDDSFTLDLKAEKVSAGITAKARTTAAKSKTKSPAKSASTKKSGKKKG